MRNLTYTDRLKIEWCLAHGMNKRQISSEIGCCLKTVYNEIERGLYMHTVKYKDECRYSADIAQQDYNNKASAKGCLPKIGRRWDFVQFIENEILNHKSSPAVALRRWHNHDGFTISIRTLYRYIDSGIYFPHLTNRDLPEKCLRKKSYHHIRRAARASKGKSIEKRPAEVAERNTFGHWEMDTIVGKAKGKRQTILVLTERLTRYELLFKLRDKSARSVVNALAKIEKKYDFPLLFKTITVDNGCEFQDCYGMEYDNKGNKRTNVYYCHPYCSCERGSNERQNRILRRFFPKSQSLYKVTQQECEDVQEWLNHYPREILGWQSPEELWREYTGI